MDLVFTQGPVARPALVVRAAARRAPTHDSDNAPPALRRRRQIGAGNRSIIVTRPARHAARRLAAPTMLTRRNTMKRSKLMLTSFLGMLFVSLAAVGINAAVDTPRTLMSPADYKVAKNAIEAQARATLARCRGVQGVEREVCKAETRAEERVKKADLAARYHGTVMAADEARQSRVKAHYEVAKARCSGRMGEDKLDCLRAARDDRNKSLAVARLAST
jgi:hypothetical protein